MIKLIVALGLLSGCGEPFYAASIAVAGDEQEAPDVRGDAAPPTAEASVEEDSGCGIPVSPTIFLCQGGTFSGLTVPEPSMICVYDVDAGSTMIPVPAACQCQYTFFCGCIMANVDLSLLPCANPQCVGESTQDMLIYCGPAQ